MITRVHHIAAVVSDLEAALAFWRDTLGLPVTRTADLEDQGVRTALLAAGTCEVELLQPLRADTGVARFHAARGDHLHHLCFESDDVGRDVKRFVATGVDMIDTRPRQGLAGAVAFVHPRACAGILVELATPPSGEALPPAPISVAAAHARVADVHTAAERYRDLFGLAAGLAAPDGSLAQLVLGGVTLQLMPTGAAAGKPGLSALRVRVPDLGALAARLDSRGVVYQRGPVGLVLAPGATRGVALIIQPEPEERRA